MDAGDSESIHPDSRATSNLISAVSTKRLIVGMDMCQWKRILFLSLYHLYTNYHGTCSILVLYRRHMQTQGYFSRRLNKRAWSLLGGLVTLIVSS